MVIDDILCVPGCEGGPVPLAKAVAVFGLGFDGLPPLCVLDRMEPDVVYAFLASPAAFDDYPERARQANKTLIEDHARVTLELPLDSVEATFRMLGAAYKAAQKRSRYHHNTSGPQTACIGRNSVGSAVRGGGMFARYGKKAEPGTEERAPRGNAEASHPGRATRRLSTLTQICS
jgi:hypothetical protein